MATALQARVARRGFPVFDLAGQSGQGTLPDSTLPAGNTPGSPTATWTDPNTDPASVGARIPPAPAYVYPGKRLWGLSGAVNPDDTPRTHAAPLADPTLPVGEYYGEADATHAGEFNGWQIRRHPGTLQAFGQSEDLIPGSPAGPLQPLDGPIRAMGGLDGVQGYGGGGDGPGGVNAYMPLTVQDTAFPGPEGHRVFVSAGEVPFMVSDAVQFTAVEPSLPPFTGVYDAPTASVLGQVPAGPDVPAQGAPVPSSAGLLPRMW